MARRKHGAPGRNQPTHQLAYELVIRVLHAPLVQETVLIPIFNREDNHTVHAPEQLHLRDLATAGSVERSFVVSRFRV